MSVRRNRISLEMRKAKRTSGLKEQLGWLTRGKSEGGSSGGASRGRRRRSSELKPAKMI